MPGRAWENWEYQRMRADEEEQSVGLTIDAVTNGLIVL